jgi:hypothetical protein
MSRKSTLSTKEGVRGRCTEARSFAFVDTPGKDGIRERLLAIRGDRVAPLPQPLGVRVEQDQVVDVAHIVLAAERAPWTRLEAIVAVGS